MKEYTNGALPPTHSGESNEQQSFGVIQETHCPYCGWAYDQPESLIPAHASCSHLVATSQWSPFWRKLNGAAVLDSHGQWRLWNTGGDGDYRRSLEKAFSSISVKIDSATASLPLYDSALASCRYYFSRRPLEVPAQLDGIQNTRVAFIADAASSGAAQGGTGPMACRC